MIEKQDWGTYPKIGFYSDKPTEINHSSGVLSFQNKNAGDGHEQFVTCTTSISPFTCLNTPEYSVNDGVWYYVEIVTKNNGTKVDLTIMEKQTGQVIGTFTDAEFPLSKFSYIGIGFYNEPNYGDDYAPIRVDNIYIAAENGQNACQPSGTGEAGTVATDLSIHVPSLNYQTLTGTQNIWVDFEFAGQNENGEMLWKLKDFGINQ